MGSRFSAAVGLLGGGWQPAPAAACARATAAGSGALSLISPVAGAPPAPILRPLRFPDATVVRMRTGGVAATDTRDYVRYGVGMSYIKLLMLGHATRVV